MNITICWKRKGLQYRKDICKRFGIPSYMSINRETPCTIRDEEIDDLKEYERSGFIEIRIKTNVKCQ